MTNEAWKIVEDYPNYMVSDHGNVMNIKRGKLLSLSSGNKWYVDVQLYREGKPKSIGVHRLVATYFIREPKEDEVINHKDKVTWNNHKDNLEWCTQQYNVEYSKAKRYSFKNPEGSRVDVFNLAKFCREESLNKGHMVQLSKGSTLRSQHKGWTLWAE